MHRLQNGESEIMQSTMLTTTLGLDSTVEDLELTSVSINYNDNLIEVYKLFDNNPSLT